MDKKSRKIDTFLSAEKTAGERSKCYFQEILRNSRDALVRYNVITESTDYMSDSIEDLTGYTVQELIEPGISIWTDRVHPDDRHIVIDQLNQCKDNSFSGTLDVLEYRFQRKDGRWIWINDTTSFVRDEQGRINAFLAVFRDVTEKKLAEELIRESEKNYVQIFNNISDSIVIHDLESGRILDVNQTLLDELGYTHEEMMNLTVKDISSGTPPYTLEVAFQQIQKAFEKGQHQFEWQAKRKNGDVFWIDLTLKSVELDGHKRILATSHNISELKAHQQLLLDSQERFRHLAESTFEGIAVCEGLTILEVNQQFADIFGYTIDELKGVNCLELTAPHGLDPVRNYVERTELGMTKDEIFESNAVRKDGTPIIVEVRSRQITWKGQPANVAAVRDITQQKLLQHQLAQSELNYRRLYEEAPVALYRTSLDGKLINCNRACLSFFGYTAEEPLENHINKIDVTDSYVDKSRRNVFIQKLKENKKIDHFEAELRRADGSTFWASISAELFAKQGYIEGAMYDITPKKILTKTEQKVLGILLQGKSNKEIARALKRSVRTIEDHRSKIMRKLEVDNAFDLTKKVLEYGIDFNK